MNVDVGTLDATQARGASAHPPQLPFVLRVGITGHRLDTLAPEAIATVEQRLGDALKLVTERARALQADAVVGLDYEISMPAGKDGMVVVFVTGTAVKLR